jgi:hypothetical protein
MQARHTDRIVRGMGICDRNGSKLGTVAQVHDYAALLASGAGDPNRSLRRQLLEVKTGLFGLGRRLYIPNGFVQDVANGSVYLSKPADEVLHNEELHYRPSYLDDLS